ncbi:MAG TPA: 2-dehydropantoate 2-reductase [Candidatus Deferrimicrobium sp.]|nr:2-dehydropantoate 2-reductase [Candidatus Deferrimicrobium sp.]
MHGDNVKIVVMGAGAIGSLFGGYLAEIGNEVSFIGRKAHIDKINQNGLYIDGIRGSRRVRVKTTTKPSDLEAPDLIILTVKAYDTKRAVMDVKSLFSASTYFMCLQNGLGTEDVAASILGEAHIIRGTTSDGALFEEPGKVRHTGQGNTVLGYLNREHDTFLKQVADMFQKAGFDTTISDDIKKVVWEKIFVNVAINPFGALTGLRNGDLLTVPQLEDSMKAAILEGLQVTEKLGLSINSQTPIVKAFEVAQRTAMNKNSMLQDIEKGKKTEIDFINGAIVNYGKKIGVSCPINAVLTALIKGLERKSEIMSLEVN